MTKTYKGKTGGGWLKHATIGPSRAGFNEVWIDGAIVTLTPSNTMVLANYDGVRADLSLSSRALRKLNSLMDEAERNEP